MKTFFMIGWRNLFRNPRRSLVVISSITVGVFAILLSMGIMNGMNNQMVDNTISTSLGHISIQHKKYRQEMKLAYGFSYTEGLETVARAAPHVIGFAPRLKLEGMLRSSESVRGVMVMGIDPLLEKGVSRVADYMTDREGSTFFTEKEKKEIIISTGMAEKLDLLVGDKVILLFQDASGEMSGHALKVKGLFRSPMESFDKFVVYVPMGALMEMAANQGMISEVVFRVDQRKNVDEAVLFLKERIRRPDLSILSWKEMAPDLFSSIQIFDTMMYLFFSIIFITVIFSVANTLIMAIMERFREIGIMKCIGTRPLAIALMVVFESISLGIAGLFFGLCSGLLFVGFFAVYGIDFSLFMESVRSVGIGHIVYPSLKPMDIIASAVIVFATTIGAAIYPAIKAAMIDPLDALHHL